MLFKGRPSGQTDGENMKITLNIVGGLLVIFGCIWFLQGINVLPGSFMSGQTRWAVYGGFAVVVGIGVLLWTNRKRKLAP
jgi:hypothetical protein